MVEYAESLPRAGRSQYTTSTCPRINVPPGTVWTGSGPGPDQSRWSLAVPVPVQEFSSGTRLSGLWSSENGPRPDQTELPQHYSHQSQHATSTCSLCRHQWPQLSRLHQAGPFFSQIMHVASAVCTYKARPPYYQLRITRIVRTKCMRVSVLGEGLGNKRCWEGAMAVGGHLVWLVTVAVTSPYTLACLGRESHVPTAI